MNCIVFNHHNSFFNRNNGHCFSAMRSLSFFNSGREDKVLKLFFSVSVKSVSYLAGQLVFNSCYYKIRSIVIAVSTVIATCLLKINFSSQLQMHAA